MKKVLDTIATIYSFIALVCLLALIGILTVEIVSRYFFSSSIIWSQEFFSIVICWITFLGFGKLVVDREDIMITFFVKKLDLFKRKIAGVVTSFLMLITSSILLFFSIQLTIKQWDKTTVIMNASTAWFYLPFVLLLGLIVLTSIYHITLSFKPGIDLLATEEGE
ncbi:TRAP transporter small permease [Virgibacillus dakarensis]|uniref:TRAP transporter small permease n=1 Tax=Virgibacillus dakarensis TaxID=1917889 RepID=UPI000B4544DA|nr:TRAP transporter small permease subunit [Virgibacillus dakarensis]